MKKNMRFPVAAGVALACLTACSGPGSSAEGGDGRLHADADYTQYASAEAVTTAADIAITGPILSVETRECDEGGEPTTEPTVDPTDPDSTDPSPDPSATSSPAPTSTPSEVAGDGPGDPTCMPMVFLKVHVSTMMKRGFGVNEGDDIVVGNIDTDAVSMEGTTPLTVGKQYALYLTRLAAGDHPGITSVPQFWIPVGGNQGIFVLAKGGVQPASANIVALTAADAEKVNANSDAPSRRPSFTVKGLRKAAAVAAAKERAASPRNRKK